MADELPNGTAGLLLLEDPGNPGTFLALEGQRDMNVDEAVGEIDTSSKDSPAMTVVGGRYDSSGSFEIIYRPSATAQTALKAAHRARNLVKMRVSEDGVEVEEADVLLTSLGREYPDQDTATSSVDFRVSGEWTAVP
jgi:hypothetical protein